MNANSISKYFCTQMKSSVADSPELSCSKHLRPKLINRPHSASASPERACRRNVSPYYFSNNINTPVQGNPGWPNQTRATMGPSKHDHQNTKLELNDQRTHSCRARHEFMARYTEKISTSNFASCSTTTNLQDLVHQKQHASL